MLLCHLNDWHTDWTIGGFRGPYLGSRQPNRLLKMETITTEFIEFLADRLDMVEEEAAEFASDLEDHGIETKEQFDEAYQGYVDEYFSERVFAENFYNEMGVIDSDHPLYSFIDWQDVWDNNLKYDYFEINGHFFRNI